MIDYVEKGIGLHNAIHEAGHWLTLERGVWVSSDDAAVQAIIDDYEEPLPPLTPDRFLYFQAKLRAVTLWQDVETYLRMSDHPLYPLLVAQRAKQTYLFEKTAEYLALLADVVTEIDPEIDLTPERLKEAWLDAATASV